MRAQTKGSKISGGYDWDISGAYLDGVEINSEYKLLAANSPDTLYDSPDDPEERLKNMLDFYRFCTYMYYVLGEEAAASETNEKKKERKRKQAIRKFDSDRKKFFNQMFKKSRTDSWNKWEYEDAFNKEPWKKWKPYYDNFKIMYSAHTNDQETNVYSHAEAALQDEKDAIDSIQTTKSVEYETDALEFSKADYKEESAFYFLGLRQDISKQEQFVLEEKMLHEFWLYVELQRKELREKAPDKIGEFDEKVQKFLDQMYGDLLNTNNWGQQKYYRLRDKYFGEYDGGYESFLTIKRDEKKSELTQKINESIQDVEQYISEIELFFTLTNQMRVSVEETNKLIDSTDHLREKIQSTSEEILKEYGPEHAEEYNRNFSDVDKVLLHLRDKMTSIAASLNQEDEVKEDWKELAEDMKKDIEFLKADIDAAKTIVSVYALEEPVNLYKEEVEQFDREYIQKLNDNLDKINQDIEVVQENTKAEEENVSQYSTNIGTIKTEEIVRRKQEIEAFREQEQGLKKQAFIRPKPKSPDEVAIPFFKSENVNSAVVGNVIAFLSGEIDQEQFTMNFDKHIENQLNSVYEILLHLESNDIDAISEKFRNKDTKDIYEKTPPKYYDNMIKARKYILDYGKEKGVYNKYTKQNSEFLVERQEAIKEKRRREEEREAERTFNELKSQFEEAPSDHKVIVDLIIKNAEYEGGIIDFLDSVDKTDRNDLVDEFLDGQGGEELENLDRKLIEYLLKALEEQEGNSESENVQKLNEILEWKKEQIEPDLSSMEWTETIEPLLNPREHWLTQSTGSRKNKLRCTEAWGAAGAGCKAVSEEMFYMLWYSEVMQSKRRYYWKSGSDNKRKPFDEEWVDPINKKDKRLFGERVINRIARDIESVNSKKSLTKPELSEDVEKLLKERYERNYGDNWEKKWGRKNSWDLDEMVEILLEEAWEDIKQLQSEAETKIKNASTDVEKEKIKSALEESIELRRKELDKHIGEVTGSKETKISEGAELWQNLQYNELIKRDAAENPVKKIQGDPKTYEFKVIGTGGGNFFQILREDKSKYKDIKPRETYKNQKDRSDLEMEQISRDNKKGNLDKVQKFEYQSSTFVHHPQAAAGLNYLYNYLRQGVPVLIGVDHTFNKYLHHDGNKTSAFTVGYNDLTTDHFMIATGAGTNAEGKRYISYFDPATQHMRNATSGERILVEEEPNIFKGVHPYRSEAEYTLTMVVPFLKDMKGDLKDFRNSNAEFRSDQEEMLKNKTGNYSSYDGHIDALEEREQELHDELMKDYQLCITKDETDMYYRKATSKKAADFVSTDVYYKDGKFYKVDANYLKPEEISSDEEIQKLIGRELRVKKLTNPEKLTDVTGELYKENNYQYEKQGEYYYLRKKL